MFEKIYGVDPSGRQVKYTESDLRIKVQNNELSDLNLIYRSNTKSAFAAFRLMSFLSNKSGKEERVTKFLVEIGTYDANKPKGSRQTSCIQTFLDEDDFAYFCTLLSSGRVFTKLRENPVAYLHHGGTSEAKRFRVYKGSKLPIILEAAQGPGIKGSNGQTIPDRWDSDNKPQVKKALIGLSEEEAVKIGTAGLRAISILDLWRAFGRDEENLRLISITKRREQSDSRYQEPRQQSGYNNNYGRSNGYNRNTGYQERYYARA